MAFLMLYRPTKKAVLDGRPFTVKPVLDGILTDEIPRGLDDHCIITYRATFQAAVVTSEFPNVTQYFLSPCLWVPWGFVYAVRDYWRSLPVDLRTKALIAMRGDLCVHQAHYIPMLLAARLLDRATGLHDGGPIGGVDVAAEFLLSKTLPADQRPFSSLKRVFQGWTRQDWQGGHSPKGLGATALKKERKKRMGAEE